MVQYQYNVIRPLVECQYSVITTSIVSLKYGLSANEVSSIVDNNNQTMGRSTKLGEIKTKNCLKQNYEYKLFNILNYNI